MVEAEARVIDQEADVATLASVSSSSCCAYGGEGRCCEPSGIHKRGAPLDQVAVPQGLWLKPGERVVVFLPRKGFLRASVALYLAPLIGLFMGGGLVAMLADSMPLPASEGWQFVGALGGAALVGFWQRRFERRLRSDPCFQLRITRRSTPCSMPSSDSCFYSQG